MFLSTFSSSHWRAWCSFLAFIKDSKSLGNSRLTEYSFHQMVRAYQKSRIQCMQSINRHDFNFIFKRKWWNRNYSFGNVIKIDAHRKVKKKKKKRKMKHLMNWPRLRRRIYIFSRFYSSESTYINLIFISKRARFSYRIIDMKFFSFRFTLFFSFPFLLSLNILRAISKEKLHWKLNYIINWMEKEK